MRVQLIVLVILGIIDRSISRPHSAKEFNATANTNMDVEVQMCGKRLSDFIELVCEGKFNSPKPGNGGHFPKSGQGLQVECCKKSCTLEHMGTYCEDGKVSPNFKAYNLPQQRNYNELPQPQQKKKPKIINNEVSKKGDKKRRRQRKNIGGGFMGKPLSMQCIYPTFAHFLLDRKRKGKIIKRPTGLIIGTVAPLELGGRPMVVHPTG